MKYILICSMFAVQLVFAQQDTYLQHRFNFIEKSTEGVPAPVLRPTLLPFDGEQSSGKKNVGMAVLYSLLLPGMGELYVGNYSTGKYLTIAEGALWLTYGGYQLYGNWIQNDARSFAAQHAGANTSGKNDQYFIDIGNFINIHEYNEQVLRDRDVHKLYDESPTSSFYWQWDSDANREQYRQGRVSSDGIFNDANFVLAAIIVNHVISAVNAARLAISHNNSIEETSSLSFHADVMGGVTHPHGIKFSVSKSF